MTDILTSQQMRDIEVAAMSGGSTTGAKLMEDAGTGVVAAIFAKWRGLRSGGRRAIVLCGPGNNGGDGYVVARLLHAAGWAVDVFAYGEMGQLPPDALTQYHAWWALGPVMPLTAGWLSGDTAPDLVVDALFGIGLNRPLPEDLVDCIAMLRHLKLGLTEIEGAAAPDTKRVAIEIASGLCADSGRVLEPEPDGAPSEAMDDADHRRWERAFQADLTVTFHRPKPGHYLADGPRWCGEVVVTPLADLLPSNMGIKSDLAQQSQAQGQTTLVDLKVAGRCQPLGRYFSDLPKPSGHKYNHGHVLVLSGGAGKGGAARLAAWAALRTGAGAVTLGCPPKALAEHAAQLNAIMLHKIKDATKLEKVLQDPRINVICLGPGFGTGPRQAEILQVVLNATRSLAGTERRIAVLDADALTLLSRDEALFAALHEDCLLTPHSGEFGRLFPDLAARLAAPARKGPAFSKIDATRLAAERTGSTVLFKGPDTIIADASGACSIHAAIGERAVPWLATAGAGDVLAGLIAGLIARGHQPMKAAEVAAWLHVSAAVRFGPGLTADDLPAQIPHVLYDNDI